MTMQIESPETKIEHAQISFVGLKTSRVALGTWAMGGWMWGGTDERESIATIHAALDRGINLVDTAPVYGFGRSEEIVGTALADGIRSRVSIATKAGLEWRDGKVYRNASRARILKEVDDSLRRLRTDYIDIYQVHWPDPLVAVEETAEAMRSLYEQGRSVPSARATSPSSRWSGSAGSRRCTCCSRRIICSSATSRWISCLTAGQPYRDARLRRAVPRAPERAHAPGHRVRG